LYLRERVEQVKAEARAKAEEEFENVSQNVCRSFNEAIQALHRTTQEKVRGVGGGFVA